MPLNTALLAVQNMEASGTVVKDQEIEFDALKKSLTMMSTGKSLESHLESVIVAKMLTVLSSLE